MTKDVRYRKHRYTANNRHYRWVYSFAQKCWVLQKPQGYCKKTIAKLVVKQTYKEPRTLEQIKALIDKRPLVSEKFGVAFIDSLLCTFETKEIRTEIERRVKTSQHFILPAKYRVEVIESTTRGEVAKICKA